VRSVGVRLVWAALGGLVLWGCGVRGVVQKGSEVEGPRGSLFIVGGGARPPELMRAALDAAGWLPGDSVAFVGWASEEPDSALFYSMRSFAAAGCSTLRGISNPPTQADLDLLGRTKLVWFGGGDQTRLIAASRAAGMDEVWHAALDRGALLGGTSAGAAVMSAKALTGDQRRVPEYSASYGNILTDNAIYTEGFGLLDAFGFRAIVDQHFIARSRFDRALTALADHPGYEVWGIDEATAVLVRPSRCGGSPCAVAQVVGAGQTVRFHTPCGHRPPLDSLVRLRGVFIDVLAAGDTVALTRAPAPRSDRAAKLGAPDSTRLPSWSPD